MSKTSKGSRGSKHEKIANGPIPISGDLKTSNKAALDLENSDNTNSTYISSPPASQAGARELNKTDTKLLTILTVFTCYIRYYKLWFPSSVVFDEVHFGGFAQKYIIGRFFMDVHPPLAKMLYAVVGYLSGYDGEFDFSKIGLDYISAHVPYVAMRMFPATLGILTVLLCYSTLRASGCHPFTAFFAGGLMAVENSLVTQSRYILLDSPLVFFMAITAYAFVKFQNYIPFQKDWFRYMFLAGLGLGATVSSKWVGLFTIGWAGALTVWQLWWILADLAVTPLNYTRQFFYRAVFLIAVPVTFYLAMFAIHFVCLANTGGGASFMSPEFQATLQHSPLIGNVPADIAYGSIVSLRHFNSQGGYLHSHAHSYPKGSKQQQVTLYSHRDQNNNWAIERMDYNATLNDTSVEFIKDGDVVRFLHTATQRRLHSHDVRPPVTERDYQNEVSAYGYKDFAGDINDNFRVEIVQDQSDKGVASERLRTIRTKFRLQHTVTGCYLFSHSVKLPKWGFEQQEVTCVKGGNVPNSIWIVEQNSHPRMDPNSTEMITWKKPSFLSKVIELNKVMWKVNAGLTDTHNWQSRPDSWPILKRGINFWGQDHRHVYLIGNVPIYYATTGLVVMYALLKVFELLRYQRGYKPYTSREFSTFDKGMYTYLLGWAFHYFPSFLMERQLFLHHYLASVYFGILALGQFFEYVVYGIFGKKTLGSHIKAKKPIYIGYSIMVAFFAASAGFFYWYSPLAYGTPWIKSVCESSKFLDMDWSCDMYPESYEEYSKLDAAVIPSTDGTNLVTVTEGKSDQQVNQQADQKAEKVESSNQENVAKEGEAQQA